MALLMLPSFLTTQVSVPPNGTVWALAHLLATVDK